MKRTRLTPVVLAGAIAVVVLYLGVAGASRARAGAAMTASATQFLAALNEEQRARARFAFEDEERLNWHFIPRPRKGLPLKEMTEAQRKLAEALLRTGLGDPGYVKVTTIIQLENVLKEIEKGSGPVRDPELYYFSVFGDPGMKGRWGWRVEGHHISFNFTVVNGTMVATTPAFLGANPAEVREGPKTGLRVLAAEEDLARALVRSLDEKQQMQAIIEKTAPRDIISMNSQKANSLEPAGLSWSQMKPAQRKALENLIEVYLGRMPEDLASERRGKLKKSGMEKVHLAWAGGIAIREPHYYRIQGPTFLVEYDNTQNNANHIHSVWRDFDGDFGRDLLREHYQISPHGR